MPSFHAGQRLSAGQLNAFEPWDFPLSSLTTSGTTELQIGAVTVTPEPVDRWVYLRMNVFGSQTVAADQFDLRIRQTSIAGPVRLLGRIQALSTVAKSHPALGFIGIELPAGQSLPLVATIQRFAGSGTFTLAGNTSRMFIDFSPLT